MLMMIFLEFLGMENRAPVRIYVLIKSVNACIG